MFNLYLHCDPYIRVSRIEEIKKRGVNHAHYEIDKRCYQHTVDKIIPQSPYIRPTKIFRDVPKKIGKNLRSSSGEPMQTPSI